MKKFLVASLLILASNGVQAMKESLLDAVTQAKNDQIESIVRSGFDVNKAFPVGVFMQLHKGWRLTAGMQALSIAADLGKIDTVNVLLRLGAHTYATDKNGRTPLMYAAGGLDNNEAVIKELLLHGALKDQEDYDGNSALFVAAESGNMHNMLILIGSGANYKKINKQNQNFLILPKKNLHQMSLIP